MGRGTSGPIRIGSTESDGGGASGGNPGARTPFGLWGGGLGFFLLDLDDLFLGERELIGVDPIDRTVRIDSFGLLLRGKVTRIDRFGARDG